MNNKQENEFNYTSEWVNVLEPKDQWDLYWMQQHFMKDKLQPNSTILEIGCGSSFCANYLKNKGFDVTTLDIDPNKKPDICANIVEYTQTKQYDYILAFEVLEHIPQKYITSVVETLKKLTKKGIFVSVPEYQPKLFSFTLQLPKIGTISKTLLMPRWVKYNKIIDPFHHWEANSSDETSIESLLSTFLTAGFTAPGHIAKFNYKHHFFYLSGEP